MGVAFSAMPHLSFAVWVLAVYGLVFLVCDAEIFAAPRRWLSRWTIFQRLFRCYFCVGIWVAAATYLFLYGWQAFVYREMLLYVSAGAAGAYLLDRVTLVLEIHIHRATPTKPPES